MANNKIQLSDGTVLLDLSNDTVTDASHIMSGRVGHLANGLQVTGTGVNCPVFTLNFDANNNITSVTCNKTFNECLTLADNGECAAIVQESHSGDIYTIYGISGYSDYDTEPYILYSYIHIYTALNDILADIRYTASGIQIISPSETLGEVNTPTAAKGSVSNHSINVTPSVTYTGGWIDSGSKTGSAVTVSASELVSGNKAITSNGDNIDVTNYATVSVNVSSGGTAAISVVDTTDSHGGTVRTITGLDISDTTAVASDVASGKYFYTANGTKTQGTASSSSDTWETLVDSQVTIVSGSPNYFTVNNYNEAIGANEQYRVTWENITYTYTTASSQNVYDGYWFGNTSMAGGSDDGSGIQVAFYRLNSSTLTGETTDSTGTKYLKIEKKISGSSSINLQARTNINPTTSSQTITADSGYDGLSSVQINAMPSGTAGTPTATKGSVSNHSITVTPSVTNTTGYITGSTINGTGVSVTASELASGNKEITSNGNNIDVVGYSTVSVNVSGGGGNSSYTRTVIAPQQTVTPTSNGTYLAATLNTSAFESGEEYIITYNGTEYFYTCTVMWSTNYVLGDINYFYGNTGYPYPFGIIWMSGTTCTLACADSTAVTVKIEKLEFVGAPSATQHTIYFEFSDETDTTITAYYDSTFISDAITATVPTTYGNKTVTLAELDGVAWYEPANIPLNTQLIDFTKVTNDTSIDPDTGEEIYAQWYCISDYTFVDTNMTFTFACQYWGAIFFYDTDKNYLGYAQLYGQSWVTQRSDQTNFCDGILTGNTFPSNTAYIRLPSTNGADYTVLSLIRTA